MTEDDDRNKEEDTSWDSYKKDREEWKTKTPPTTARRRPWDLPSEGDIATSPVNYEWLRKEHEIAHSWKTEAKQERSFLQQLKNLLKRK